ncbi:MAG: hypothetical protein DRJ26_02900 [Candidatus Methanomethylicota archaeon]|uniref:YbaK/aminoacyl-tRNA synthetase-associated domain-containing protein n=1 Tax=Thermoproteota archaeon TaxID=2056631 RepID=A0A497F4J0_9CREN|nr:MAG: hypothetical protein DRJ26_02900 [Candidatus Verstraetearchaeota archaeon]
MSGIDLVKKFIKDKGVKAEILLFQGTVESVEKASIASGVKPSQIIKTLLLKANGEVIAVLLPGNKRLDYKKLKAQLKARKVRLLYPEEVKKISGMNIGEVSPLTHAISKLKIIADTAVQELGEVLVGGGSIKSLVKIEAQDLIKTLNPKIGDISK